MALKWADNCVEESTSTTTGAYQLGGVPGSGELPGAQTFVAGIGDTHTCYYYAYEVGGTDWERGIGTVADATPDTLTRTTIHGSSNGGAAVDWTGKTVRVRVVEPARSMYTDHAGMLENATIACSRASNAETFALKTLAGTDPSASDPVRIAFAKTDGTFEVLEATAALSLTVSSGSTLGAVDATEFKVAVGIVNDAGTLRLAVSGRPSGLRDNSVVSSTAEGGAGGAGTARTIYTGTAVTSKRMRILGYYTYNLATSGTWNTAPTDALLTRAGAMEIYAAEVLCDTTLGSGGAFDTNDQWPAGLPAGYASFKIECRLRSTVAATLDAAYVFFNNDTTVANYASERFAATDGAIAGARADTPQVGEVPGATSQTDDFGFVWVEIPAPNDAKNKLALSYGGYRRSATSHRVDGAAVQWESTAAVTRIQVRTDNHATDLFAAGSSWRVLGYRTLTVLV